jgi:GLPGLI family protein
MRIATALAVLFIALVSPAAAQDSFEGVITSEVKVLEAPKEMQQMMHMMNQQVSTYVKGPRTRIEQSGVMGKNIIIQDPGQKKMIMLMDMMGQKIAMEIPLDVEPDNSYDIFEFEYNGEPVKMTGEKKTISGYACEKGILQVDGGAMEIWFAKDFPFASVYDSRMPGMPVQYVVREEEMVMEFTLTGIKEQAVSESMFTIPSEYTVKTAAEMQQFMPLMEGGFGDE